MKETLERWPLGHLFYWYYWHNKVRCFGFKLLIIGIPLLDCSLRCLCVLAHKSNFSCCHQSQDMTGLDAQEETEWRFCKIPHTNMNQGNQCVILIVFVLWRIQMIKYQPEQCNTGDCVVHVCRRCWCALCTVISTVESCTVWLQTLSKRCWSSSDLKKMPKKVANYIFTTPDLLISHNCRELILYACTLYLCVCAVIGNIN